MLIPFLGTPVFNGCILLGISFMNPKSFKRESESEQKIDEEIFAILI
jgi:hypothetical protein